MFPVEFSYSEIEGKNLNHLYPVKNSGVTCELVTLSRRVSFKSLYSHWSFLNNVT